jgi:hypothetical protein
MRAGMLPAGAHTHGRSTLKEFSTDIQDKRAQHQELALLSMKHDAHQVSTHVSVEGVGVGGSARASNSHSRGKQVEGQASRGQLSLFVVDDAMESNLCHLAQILLQQHRRAIPRYGLGFRV